MDVMPLRETITVEYAPGETIAKSPSTTAPVLQPAQAGRALRPYPTGSGR